MSLARVQHKINGSVGGTPSVTPTSPTTAGSFLVAVTGSASGFNLPAGWTKAVTGPLLGVNIWHQVNAAPVTTLSATGTSSGDWYLGIIEYSGFGAGTPTVLTNTSASQTSSGPVSPGAAAVVVAGLTNDGADTVSSPTGGFSILDQQLGTDALAVLDQVTTGGGTFTAGVTGPGSDNWGFAVASFVPGPAAATPQPSAPVFCTPEFPALLFEE